MKFLEYHLVSKIEEKIKLSEEFFFSKDFEKAIEVYKDALNLIPEPKNSWNESWAYFYGISEMYFHSNNLEEALMYLKKAIESPNGLGNPHIHLRIGQIRFELEQTEKAKDELMRAYMGAGLEIFENEDPKYFKLIESYV